MLSQRYNYFLNKQIIFSKSKRIPDGSLHPDLLCKIHCSIVSISHTDRVQFPFREINEDHVKPRTDGITPYLCQGIGRNRIECYEYRNGLSCVHIVIVSVTTNETSHLCVPGDIFKNIFIAIHGHIAPAIICPGYLLNCLRKGLDNTCFGTAPSHNDVRGNDDIWTCL